jgi:Helix-turn-helix of DDE superfamily endonuclease
VLQVISAERPDWVPMFTGLTVRQFGKLVRIVAARGGEQTGTGRRWGLSLTDRVLLVVAYYRTNLTYRQVAQLFGISKSAAGRIVEHLAPLLVLSPVKEAHGPDMVLIVDGTLVPTHDRSMSASSKNYWYSVNMQVVIDANTDSRSRLEAPRQATATTAAPSVTRESTANAEARRSWPMAATRAIPQ